MQITYLPYLSMHDCDEITFADLNVKIWNYGHKRGSYVKDCAVLSMLDGLMAANVWHSEPLSDIGIVSIGEINFREYTPQEQAIVDEVRLRLFAGGLSLNAMLNPSPNRGHSMITSDNFDVTCQNFNTSRQHFGIMSGSIVRKNDIGYAVNELRYSRPEYVPTPIKFDGDESIIELLRRLKKYQKRLYIRVMRALELALQAYRNDENVSENSRILLMASAYEVLFDLPDSRQRKVLKEKIEELFVSNDDLKVQYESIQGTKRVRETKSIKVMWADKFYSLRNAISHGDNIKAGYYEFRGKQRHLDIAILFFILGIKKIAGEKNHIRQTYDRIEWKSHAEHGEPPDSPFNYEAFIYENVDLFTDLTRKAGIKY